MSLGSAGTRLLADADLADGHPEPADDKRQRAQLAASAVRAVERLTKHVAQLLGDSGTLAVWSRSASVASATHPWLAGTVSATERPESRWNLLRAAFERQNASTLRAGFDLLLSGFVAVLERLIGEGLVRRVLYDAWPDVFPLPSEEST